MEFKQDNGKVLKGFSQVDLDELNINIKKNNELIKTQTKMYGAIAAVLIIVVLWVLWQLKTYHIVTDIIRAIGKC